MVDWSCGRLAGAGFARTAWAVVAPWALVLGGLLVMPAVGRAAVTATGDVNPNPPTPNSFVQVGDQTFGNMTIDAGSVLALSGLEVGDDGFGTTTVTGLGSMLSVNGGVDVGRRGVGGLNVLDGAFVQTGFLNLATDNNGLANVRVAGAGSVLSMSSELRITDPFSDRGFATVTVENDGLLDTGFGETQVGRQGTLVLNGGMVRSSGFDNQGVISGHGRLLGDNNRPMQNDGRIEVGAGQKLEITAGPVTNNAQMMIQSGELVLSSELRINGQVTLEDSALRVGPPVEFSQGPPSIRNALGQIAAVGGVNDIYGRVDQTFPAEIAVTNESLLRFSDDVSSSGKISVFGGSKAIFLGDLTLVGGSFLADFATDQGFGETEVVGELRALGTIQLGIGAGVEAQLGDRFPLITAGGGITGNANFLIDNPPPLALGEIWDVEVGPNSVSAVVVEGLAGDFNGDRVVDTADYAVWRNGLGTDFLPWQLDQWRANLGLNFVPIAAEQSASAVPEPASCLLLLLASSGVAWRVRGR